MNDSGAGTPPFSAYPINGHTVNPADPQNPANVPGYASGDWIQNDSNFTVNQARVYRNAANIGEINVTHVGNQVSIQFAGTLVSATSLTGTWTPVTPQPSSPYQFTPTGALKYFRVIP
jgi:hypothetical protein